MTAKSQIHLARVYDDLSHLHGTRLLVDRLWPRGLRKEDLQVDEWVRDIAPSTELRHWFNHEPEKWSEFQRRYLNELANNLEAVERCLVWLRKGSVTLLYAAKDSEHNNAVVLANFLPHMLKK
jgi:uncharacterized protein YeaO (DUF488 family)